MHPPKAAYGCLNGGVKTVTGHDTEEERDPSVLGEKSVFPRKPSHIATQVDGTWKTKNQQSLSWVQTGAVEKHWPPNRVLKMRESNSQTAPYDEGNFIEVMNRKWKKTRSKQVA
eukprot:GHVL01029709.1.p1 GENE.GHVL01029709.1~~GHVL01029709.1.p1  ORF type:complete len:114 (-),score=11.50 GHVL01029709.1:100-441(-)